MELFKKYKKKPQVLNGAKLTVENIEEVHKYILDKGQKAKLVKPMNSDKSPYLKIETLEGEMEAHPPSVVMEGIKGEFWAIREDIFSETYDEIIEDKSEEIVMVPEHDDIIVNDG